MRAGERAFAITEEFGLKQVLWNGAAIHRNEGQLAARRDFMNRARHQFLARARLATHQHRRHAARDLLDEAAHLLHHVRGTGQAVERAARRGTLALGAALACTLAPTFTALTGRRRRSHGHRAAERRCHHGAELLQINRLGEVVIRAGLQRFDGVFSRTVSGDDDGLFVAAGLL